MSWPLTWTISIRKFKSVQIDEKFLKNYNIWTYVHTAVSYLIHNIHTHFLYSLIILHGFSTTSIRCEFTLRLVMSSSISFTLYWNWSKDAMTSLETRDKAFFLDGQKMMLFSGAMHYFRVVPEYWKDRMLRMKACGLNTLETWVDL